MKIFIIIVVLLVFTNCLNQAGKQEYVEINKIHINQQEERLAKFSSYPIEKQIDVYLFANYKVEGGDGSFLWYLTVNGERKIPQIVSRIVITDSPMLKSGLISALNRIDENCFCVSDNEAAINILSENEMKLDTKEDSAGTQYFKNVYSEELRKIKHRSVQ